MPPKPSSRHYFLQLSPKLKVYSLVIVLSLLVFFSFLLINNYFQLKTIQVEGEKVYNKLSGLESLKGSNLLFLSPQFIKETITNSNPAIVIEDITKEYPDKIYINIKSLEQLAQLKLNIGFAQLSENGKIIKKIKEKDKNLPIINFYQKFDYYQLNVGEDLDHKEVTTALFLLKRCYDLDLKIESIDISGLSIIVFNLKDPPAGEAGKKIYFSGEKERENQANELETLLIQFKIKAQNFKVLDLRFDKPIVKF